RPTTWQGNAFLGTSARNELEARTRDYPQRWHSEEFFNDHQALGWDRAGPQNLNIRYGHMTMARIAQAVLRRWRQRLGAPLATWDAPPLARSLLQGREGDVRVR